MARRGPKPGAAAARATPLRGTPEPPSGLDAQALAHWTETASKLAEAGILSRLDQDALELYITTWRTYRDARKALAEEGEVLKLDNGTRCQNPWYKIAKDCQRSLERLLDSFGLTPKSRDRLSYSSAEPTDAKADAAKKWEQFN